MPLLTLLCDRPRPASRAFCYLKIRLGKTAGFGRSYRALRLGRDLSQHYNRRGGFLPGADMGTKTSALLLSPGDLIDEDELLEICGVPPSVKPTADWVESVFSGYDDKVAIADFPKGKALFAWDPLMRLGEADDPGEHGPSSPLGAFLEHCSVEGSIAYVALGSATNLYSLVLWRDGALARAVSGSANDNDGLPWINLGKKLRFEPSQAYAATRRIEQLRETASREAYRAALDAYLEAADGTGEALDYPSLGEDLVFELIEEMLGSRPDRRLHGQPIFSEVTARVFARSTPGADAASREIH